MSLNEQPTLYDVLDLSPDASAKDIHEAYTRIKSTYNKDSVALYTLVSADEREQMLSQLDEAHQVLSNPERRKEYDRCHGLLVLENQASAMPEEDIRAGIISIDRVPPMETLSSDDLLVPPSTSFENTRPIDPNAGTMTSSWIESTSVAPQSETRNTGLPPVAPVGTADSDLIEEIAREIEWPGVLLKRVRENKKISVEEMSGITKISRTYLQAIESENFAKLPAAVFVRGFITQIAKILRLPHDKVAPAYLARYYQARPDQRT